MQPAQRPLSRYERPVFGVIRALCNFYLIIVTKVLKALFALLIQPYYLFDFGIMTYWINKLSQ